MGFFIVLFFLIPDKGLNDLLPPTVGILVTFQALGDRMWARNVEAAAWLRVIGIATMFAGVGALATHFYIEQQWGWMTYILAVCAILLCWGIYLFVRRNHDSARSSPSD